MALTQNQPRDYQIGKREDYPIAADSVIYEGAAVGENGSGFARPLQAADVFLGFAICEEENAGTAGAKNISVHQYGKITLQVTGVADITANNRPAVYASDDNTFTLTSTGNSKIGHVSRHIDGAMCVVEFDALASLA